MSEARDLQCDNIDLAHAPAHLIRRAQQVAVAVFMQAAAALDVTPVQYAFLSVLVANPGVDQVTLANLVALDAATAGAVLGRLEAKGWLSRQPDAQDKRRKLIWLTPRGQEAARQLAPIAQDVQMRIVAPLSEPERELLLELLRKLVAGHA